MKRLRCPVRQSKFFGETCGGPVTVRHGQTLPQCRTCLKRQAAGLDPIKKDTDELYLAKKKKRKPF